MIIYLDMDDVVADWLVSAQEFLKLKWDKEKGERIPESEWDKLKEHSRFYRQLPLKPGARQLVSACEQYVAQRRVDEIRFLTALPSNDDMPWAVYDKVHWAREHFATIPVFIGPYSQDKWRHCKPGDILIDDRTSNCKEWIQAGGHAHIYRSWEECKPWLAEILK